MKAGEAFVPAGNVAAPAATETNRLLRRDDKLRPRIGSASLTRAASGGLARQNPARTRPVRATLVDLRGGFATLLGCVYIAVLIPNMLGPGAPALPLASISGTAFACATGTALFALITRLPFAVGPGIVPASIIASFLASGIPFKIVLGIEVIAGLLFLGLVVVGAMEGMVRRMPPLLKLVGQIAIGLYLFLVALRATGILPSSQIGPGIALHQPGLLFIVGLGAVFWLSSSSKYAGYAILIGILMVTFGAALLGLVSFPSIAFEFPALMLFKPDIASAFNLVYLDEVLILLYVVVVDVVATLETIATCAPEMRGEDTRPIRFNQSMWMSAIVFLLSPFLGTAPMLVFFESLGGVLSGARTHRAALVTVLGFVVLMFFAPVANAIPAFACAVALGYIGYTITKHAAIALPIDPSSMSISSLGRHLTSAAVALTFVTQSVALTIISLFAIYPIAALRSGQRIKLCDAAISAACAGLIASMML